MRQLSQFLWINLQVLIPKLAWLFSKELQINLYQYRHYQYRQTVYSQVDFLTRESPISSAETLKALLVLHLYQLTVMFHLCPYIIATSILTAAFSR